MDDNPQLTTRDWKGTDPLRLVLDPNLRTPKNTTLYKDNTATYFFHKQPKATSDSINRYIFLNPYNLKEFFDFWCRYLTSTCFTARLSHRVAGAEANHGHRARGSCHLGT